MKISIEWLKHYVPCDIPAARLADDITALGHEVESVQVMGIQPNDKLVVGEVLTRDKHPNADKLSVCQVNVGQGAPLQIVCGAQNYKVGDRVPVALVGCSLPDGKGGTFDIKAAKLRGVESQGMMCAADEIGLGGDHGQGLMILPPQASIGVALHSLLKNDTILEVKSTPNRPDVLSHRGLARDLAAKWGVNLYDIPYSPVVPVGATSSVFSGVSVASTDDCPQYRAYVIRGVKVAPSPAWLQDILKAVGLKPICNIVDITNYICLGLGQPLHAFDLAKIGGRQLVVRRASTGEKLTTLDGKVRSLDADTLVIANATKPLVVAGIMGGQESGVSATTTDIVLEAAQFHPTLIRRSVRRLVLSSDSSQRYERGIDPLALQKAAERAVALILEMAGGALEAVSVAGSAPSSPKTIDLSREYLAAQLGFSIDCEVIENALTRFGFGVEPVGQTSWRITVPSYRIDIEWPVDFVEEVLRFVGNERIPHAPLALTANESQNDPAYTIVEAASQRLAAMGCYECMHYSLRAKEELERIVGADNARLHSIENPISGDMSHLRSSLVPGLIDALELNRARGNEDAVKLFEVGHVFGVVGGRLAEYVSIAWVQKISPLPQSWQSAPAPDFWAAKAVVEALAAATGIALPSTQWQRVDSSTLWQPYHAATLGQLDEHQLKVSAGLVSLEQLRVAGLAGSKVLAAEIILDRAIFANLAHQDAQRYTPFSVFPGARRDIALIVGADIKAGDVERNLKAATIKALAGKCHLEGATLFDVYHGVAEGKKSLAFALNLRAMDRTLTDDEVNTAMVDVVAQMKAAGYEPRG